MNANDTEESDRFGNAVDFDGKHLIVGAYSANAPQGDSGAAYIFARQGNSWIQQAKLTANDGDSFDWFGAAVAISGDVAVVGAIREDGKGFTVLGLPISGLKSVRRPLKSRRL